MQSKMLKLPSRRYLVMMGQLRHNLHKTISSIFLSKRYSHFILLLFLGIGIRLLLIPHPGFEADVAYWKGWGLAVGDKGLLWLVKNTNFNYPPGFAYILFFVHKIYSLFANPHAIQEFWVNTNLLYLFLIKSISVISDIVIVGLIVSLGRSLRALKIALIVAVVYFLNPATLFDGPVWGQVDQFGLALFLTSFYFLYKKRSFPAAVFFTVSCLMKLQNIIFIPLFYVYIGRQFGFSVMVRSVALSVGIFISLSAPFFLFHEFPALYRLLTVNSDWFPFYSLNAFNVWWLISGTKGLTMVDKELVLGVLSAKQLGLIIFSCVYVVALVSVVTSSAERASRQFIIACSLVVFAFFHLLTQSHERYLYHLVGFLLVIMLFDGKKHVVKSLTFYAFFSILFFLNMYIAFYLNYPKMLFFPFSLEAANAASVVVAFLQIMVFVGFVGIYYGKWLRKHLGFSAAVLGLCIVVILVKNIPYLLRRPIQLTTISPIEKSQDYQTPQIGKTVDSAAGPFAGFRLSANYYFYNQGIGSHADSRLVYGLNGKFSHFETEFAVDTEAGTDEKLVFIIEADGRELYRSEPMGRFDPPAKAKVRIRGAGRLALLIVSPSGNKAGAHADWLNPVVVR